MIAPSGEQIELASGEHRAVVTEVGAGLRVYRHGGHDLIDGYDADRMCQSGRGQQLMPWPNRIRNGAYEFDGSQHQLPLTEAGSRNAIHGLVRWARFTVREREPQRAVMGYVLHPQPGYPFALDLAVEYELSGEGLRVTATATNVGAAACPFGGGAHPYLTVGTDTIDDVTLCVPARAVIRSDERGLPIETVPVEGTAYDFREGRPIGATVLDNAFTDLVRDDDGLARVRLQHPHGGAGLVLWADAGYPYLMVFSGDPLADVDRRALAVEPMTCPPNAFRTGESLIRLEPGASTSASWGISPTPPAAD